MIDVVLARMLFEGPGNLDLINRFNLSPGSYDFSEGDTVTLMLPPSKFKEIFSCEIDRKENESGIKWLSNKQKIILPDGFSETVKVYIPRAPELMSRRLVPPKVDVHHFTIHDLPWLFNAAASHRQGHLGSGVKIAMVDSGIDISHPFIRKSGLRIHGNDGLGLQDPFFDEEGHGTGEFLNILALAPDAEVTSFNLLPNGAEVALSRAIREGFQIINCSWGIDLEGKSRNQIKETDEDTFYQIIDLENIVRKTPTETILVFAAGNGHYAFPGCMPEVISVGGIYVDAEHKFSDSSDSSAFVCDFYERQKEVPCICGIIGDLVGGQESGHLILPTPNNCFQYNGRGLGDHLKDCGWGLFSGTSAAAPQICGILALMKGINHTITKIQALQILRDSATDVAVRSGISFLLPDVNQALALTLKGR